MLGVTDFSAFVLTILLFLLLPGPGNLALITSTSKGGVRGGLSATIGLILGDQVLMWLAVAGVATLISTYPNAFQFVQWAGAAYLTWLGGKMLLTKPSGAPVVNIKPSHYLQQSFTITLLNPKAIIFYMAFFPLFIDKTQHPTLLVFGAMAFTIAVLTFAYGLLLVLLVHFLASQLRANPVTSRVLTMLAGLCLIGFGIKLAITR